MAKMDMSKMAGERHEHKSMSSRNMLNATKILNDIGLKRGYKFLDAGSGEGYFSIEEKKEIGEKNLGNIEATVADLSLMLSLADESIDVVFISNVLHGLVANGEWERALKEVSRVTRASGKLAVVEFKKGESPMGPPLSIRLSLEEVEFARSRSLFSAKALHLKSLLIRAEVA